LHPFFFDFRFMTLNAFLAITFLDTPLRYYVANCAFFVHIRLNSFSFSHHGPAFHPKLECFLLSRTHFRGQKMVLVPLFLSFLPPPTPRSPPIQPASFDIHLCPKPLRQSSPSPFPILFFVIFSLLPADLFEAVFCSSLRVVLGLFVRVCERFCECWLRSGDLLTSVFGRNLSSYLYIAPHFQWLASHLVHFS